MGLFSKLFGKGKSASDSPDPSASSEELLQEVEVSPGVLLPAVLVDHWPAISKAKKTYISITATPSETLTLQQSKFYHYPCIPNGYAYPTDSQGKYMLPLAQINFKECPPIEGFPTSGFLQFYIADNDVYGLDFGDQQSQKDFKVLYFKEEDVRDPHWDFSFLHDLMQSDLSPVSKPCEMSFTTKEEYFSMSDYHGRLLIEPIANKITQQYPTIEGDLSDILCEDFVTTGHKLGGYAYFTQNDPREFKKEWADRILLFQIDSDDNITWGDGGVANFFIEPDKLAKLDFSNVVYNWDCY